MGIEYEYECSNCHHTLEAEQSIKDKPLKVCPKCKKHKLERMISGGIGAFVDQDPTTIGQLADKNTKRNKNKIQEAHAKKNESIVKPEKPWYHKYGDANPKEIARMTPAQKTRYIMEGKK